MNDETAYRFMFRSQILSAAIKEAHSDLMRIEGAANDFLEKGFSDETKNKQLVADIRYWVIKTMARLNEANK